jgi:hypothetical protein
LANDETKPDVEEEPEELAIEQNKVSEVKTETRTKARTSLRRPPNWTVRFPKPDHLVLVALGQRQTLRTTMPGTAPTPCWCPPGFTRS